jgi:hypothetical protein
VRPEIRHHPLAILRMNILDPPLGLGLGSLGGDPQQLGHALCPNIVGGLHIRFPNSRLGSLGRQFQALLAILCQLLRLLGCFGLSPGSSLRRAEALSDVTEARGA